MKFFGLVLLWSLLSFQAHAQLKEKDTLLLARIAGGGDAPEAAYPYFTLILTPTASGFLKCGGTLVHTDIVMTAAHCVDDTTHGPPIASVNFTAPSNAPQRQVVTSIRIHPDFSDAKSFRNDIALLKLAQPITDIDTVTISSDYQYGGESVTAVGYGRLSEAPGDNPSTIQQVNIPVQTMQDCNDQNSYRGAVDETTQLCAGQTGMDACKGDSGGPLVSAADGKQVGIVSTGIGCARPNLPGIYTRLSHYTKWIDDSLCAMSSVRPPTCPLVLQDQTALRSRDRTRSQDDIFAASTRRQVPTASPQTYTLGRARRKNTPRYQGRRRKRTSSFADTHTDPFTPNRKNLAAAPQDEHRARARVQRGQVVPPAAPKRSSRGNVRRRSESD